MMLKTIQMKLLYHIYDIHTSEECVEHCEFYIIIHVLIEFAANFTDVSFLLFYFNNQLFLIRIWHPAKIILFYYATLVLIYFIHQLPTSFSLPVSVDLNCILL